MLCRIQNQSLTRIEIVSYDNMNLNKIATVKSIFPQKQPQEVGNNIFGDKQGYDVYDAFIFNYPSAWKHFLMKIISKIPYGKKYFIDLIIITSMQYLII